MTSTPPRSQLPTKVKFFRDLDIIEACDICHEAFNEEHKATRTQCQHIFGPTCLKKWIDTNHSHSNTCPTCRRTLFLDSTLPAFHLGSRPDVPRHFTLDMFIDTLWSQAIVHFMWNAMSKLIHKAVIYDAEIDAQIHKVGWYAVHDTFSVFHIGPYYLNRLRELAKEMIKEQVETAPAELVQPADGRPRYGLIREIWLLRVAEILGWQLVEHVPGTPAWYELELPDQSRWRWKSWGASDDAE